MLNRYLSLLVSVVAPASAAVMLFAGARTLGTVAVADRLPCIGLALVALALAVLHLRSVRSTNAEGAMWSALAFFFAVAAFASPHLGAIAVVATLALGATSLARLVAGSARASVAQSPIRRRIFAA